MSSVVSLTSFRVHQRCPVMNDRSNSSCPAVSITACGTRRKKNECAPRNRVPSCEGHFSPDRVAIVGSAKLTDRAM
jgi:hypothetical protein